MRSLPGHIAAVMIVSLAALLAGQAALLYFYNNAAMASLAAGDIREVFPAQAARQMLLVIATSLAAFGIVTALVCSILKRAMAPVARLARLLSREDAALVSPGEIGAVRAATGEIEDLIAALGRLQGDHARRRDALLAAKEAAETTSRARSEFITDISRELRTSLNSIIGLVALLSESRLPDETLGSLAAVERSSRDLMRSVSNILDMSRIESATLKLETVPFGLAACLQAVVQALRPQPGAGGAALSADIDVAEDLRVLGDPRRFSQALASLVDNALRYTERGRVMVSVRCVPDSESGCHVVVAEVTDTGIGIDKDKLDLLFGPSAQAGAPVAREHGGLGLGLAIARHLAQLMGGGIEAESALGVGSKFTLRVPFVVAGRHRHDAFSSGRKEVTRIPAAGARVLVAEDHKMNQLFMKKLLAALGIGAVRIVGNGREARDIILAGEADIVLMDCHMPEMSGYEATRAIRAAEKEAGDGRRAPVVAMTADALAEAREKCLAHGMDEYLSKPVDKLELVRVLSGWIHFPEESVRETPAVKADPLEDIPEVKDNALSAQRGDMTPEEQKQKVILIVDDDAMVRMILRSMLKKQGYAVLEAEEGGKALDTYLEYRPDLILCDRMMPAGMSGFDFLVKLRDLPSDVPFVFLTSLTDQRDQMAVADMGVSDYLSKPVTEEALRTCIARIIG